MAEPQTFGKWRVQQSLKERPSQRETRDHERGAARAVRFVQAVSGPPTREIALGKDVFAVTAGELELLLASLRRLDSRDAATVAEQIAALRLAGGVIGLTPTEAEHAALRQALAEERQPLTAVLLRLACLCGHGSAVDEQPA
jgi:hypothetical protein